MSMSTPNILRFANNQGKFARQASAFRNHISKDADSKFNPEVNRYHLYVSLACPWAHRTMIVRAIKRLENVIGLSVVDYLMGERGWKFSDESETPGCIPDNVNHAKHLCALYYKADPSYKGRFTVPVLWDKKLNTIVNNESSEIIRMLNSEFNEFIKEEHPRNIDLFPFHLRKEIEEINEWIYDSINNGVYKTGFTTDQKIYEENCIQLFKALDRVEGILKKNMFLLGENFSESDIRLFTTIVRFDPVYHGHFKCNLKTIEFGYPYILNWARRVYQLPEIAKTVNVEHIKKHYYMSHLHINPNAIVPLHNGPDLNLPVVDLSELQR